MFLHILFNLGSVLSIMIESVQKCVMNVFSHDFKSTKLVTSFNVSFAVTAAIVLILGLVLNSSWIPSLFFWTARNVSPARDSTQKALVATHTNINSLRTERRLRLNFLPESQELKVYDDDELLLESDKLPIFRSKQKQTVSKENGKLAEDQEAVLSLTMAIQMKEAGKYEKATKLFQHALALNPLHPDVLNHYGEFLEEHNKDVLKANHLYTRALIVSPEHSKAIVNCERTLPLVEELDQIQLTRIDKKRDHLVHIPDTDPALKRVKKEAYFQHIYHTVAIEGNTMTLAETRMIVETRMAVPGKSILEHNEILGLESALKYINSTLVSKMGMIHMEDILQIHKRVLGHADPLEAGMFRRSQVYVGEHTPPKPEDILPMMDSFIEWLNSEDAYTLHPVKYAGLAHYKLVHIHPFVDGNGRTSRLLMNLILMRVGYPPVIIRKQDRSMYYEFLQLANEGDARPFIRFIAECTERTMDVYLYATEYGMASMRALGSQNDGHVKIIEM